jgi:hypothetical protein
VFIDRLRSGRRRLRGANGLGAIASTPHIRNRRRSFRDHRRAARSAPLRDDEFRASPHIRKCALCFVSGGTRAV